MKEKKRQEKFFTIPKQVVPERNVKVQQYTKTIRLYILRELEIKTLIAEILVTEKIKI